MKIKMSRNTVRINSIQYGGGWGHYGHPYRYFLYCVKTVAAGFIRKKGCGGACWASENVIFESPGTQLVAMATLLSSGV